MADDTGDSINQSATDPVGLLVVKESRSQREILFGFLTVVIALALVSGTVHGNLSGATLVAEIAVAVVLVLVVAGWWLVRRDPHTIEVTVERIRYRSRSNSEYPDFVREQGTDLRLYVRNAGRINVLVLEQTATSIAWTLRFFTRDPIVEACTARGWRVVDNRGLAA